MSSKKMDMFLPTDPEAGRECGERRGVPPTFFSAASYNIHQAIGADGRRDRRRIGQVLKQLDADVIGLQEVDNNSEDQMLQLDYLVHETGLRAVAGTTMRRRDSDYGNVLLTRHR